MGPVAVWLAVREYLKGANAYDPSTPDKCTVMMSTTDGTNCEVSVQCRQTDAEGDRLPADQACFLNGRQYLTHPQLGDFSVTWTKAGGVNSDIDGLSSPVLQFANLNDWEALDVQASLDGNTESGNLCGSNTDAGGVRRNVFCGIPQIGQAAYGISNYEPVDEASGFAPGWCTMHVVQYQRNEFGVGPDYQFDVIIKDADEVEIGKVQGAPIDAVTKALSVTSHLPNTVDIIAAGGDDDPVVFKYGGQTWQDDDEEHQSTFSKGEENGFESGNRKGDMGFTC